MPTVNNVEHLRKWFRQCPALSKANHFRVDYLAEEATEYALYAVPSTVNSMKMCLASTFRTIFRP